MLMTFDSKGQGHQNPRLAVFHCFTPFSAPGGSKPLWKAAAGHGL